MANKYNHIEDIFDERNEIKKKFDKVKDKFYVVNEIIEMSLERTYLGSKALSLARWGKKQFIEKNIIYYHKNESNKTFEGYLKSGLHTAAHIILTPGIPPGKYSFYATLIMGALYMNSGEEIKTDFNKCPVPIETLEYHGPEKEEKTIYLDNFYPFNQKEETLQNDNLVEIIKPSY